MNFLNFKQWRITDVVEEKNLFSVCAVYEPEGTTRCPVCAAAEDNLCRYGNRVKCIKDAPVRGKKVSVRLTVQRYLCLTCMLTFLDEVPEIASNSRLTRRLIRYIEEQSISINKSFRGISLETGASASAVSEIFTRFIERTARESFDKTPEALGIDEVYVGRVARCIITDLTGKKVIELLPKRDRLTVFRYLLQMKDKEKVKFVCIDMWRPYHQVIRRIFPSAKIVIDTFHVQRQANQAINKFFSGSFKFVNIASKSGLGRRDRFLLMKRKFRLTEKQRQNLSEWMEAYPDLKIVYTLKEEFLQIWQRKQRPDAEKAYASWKRRIPPELEPIFRDMIKTVENWHEEIFNYFDCRLSNAFTESANSLIKLHQRNGRGISFEVIRIKILYKYSPEEESE